MAIDAIKIKGKITNFDEKEDFEIFILDNIESSIIEKYAARNLGMIHEDDCECEACEDFDVSDATDTEFEEEAHERGLILFKPNSIVEASKIKEIIESQRL